MHTKFSTIEEAQRYAVAHFKIDYKTAVVFQEVPGFEINNFAKTLLDFPGTPERIRRNIQARIAAQKGYRAQTPMGEIKIVIGQLSKGFDCWVIGSKGLSTRL